MGRHVVALLRAGGHDVLGVDSLDERVHPEPRTSKSAANELAVDLYLNTPQTFLDECDAVIHLAAQVSVADSADDPLRYIEQNSADTAEFLQRCPPKRLIVASSMSVYGEGGVRVTEQNPVCPTSVYGLTKYDQERLCLIWGQRHGIPVTALRFFNIFGPGQALTNPYTGVLANFASAMLNDRAPTIFEDGLQTRDFIHVSDVAGAVVAALTESSGGVFNVCTGQATTILEAAQLLRDALGKEHLALKVTGTTRPGDIRHCTGDPSKAENDLGFVSQVSFAQGITEYAMALQP